VITGASKGIGREIAIQFAAKMAPDSLFLLLARSESGLEQTKTAILSGSKEVRVEVALMDLSNTKSVQLFGEILSNLCGGGSEYQHFIIVHNAGSLGELKPCRGMKTASSVDELNSYFTANLTSMIVLNQHFFAAVPNTSRRSVIHITSLLAIEPAKSMSLYCTGKAARDMYWRVFAKENPDVNVLSYAPGPVETEMLQTVRENVKDLGLSASVPKQDVLTTELTVGKLIAFLESGGYESGDHVDYCDDISTKSVESK